MLIIFVNLHLHKSPHKIGSCMLVFYVIKLDVLPILMIFFIIFTKSDISFILANNIWNIYKIFNHMSWVSVFMVFSYAFRFGLEYIPTRKKRLILIYFGFKWLLRNSNYFRRIISLKRTWVNIMIIFSLNIIYAFQWGVLSRYVKLVH